VDCIAWRGAAVDLEAAPSLLASGVALAMVILSVAVAIVMVRGSRSAKEPDWYALQVLKGLPDWLCPWRARGSEGRSDQQASTGVDSAGPTLAPGQRPRSAGAVPLEVNNDSK